ncbi:MAG: rod-binding protein [SAR324 cluster bacterium]|nr:rod-binding protein [SAR324 cluster bacterium]
MNNDINLGAFSPSMLKINLNEAKDSAIEKKLSHIKEQNSKFNESLKKAAMELETLHINGLLKELRSAENSEDDLFGNSLAQEFYKGMLDEEYARIMAESSRFGLAKMVVEFNQRKD